jgi:hypothetical protein
MPDQAIRDQPSRSGLCCQHQGSNEKENPERWLAGEPLVLREQRERVAIHSAGTTGTSSLLKRCNESRTRGLATANTRQAATSTEPSAVFPQ